jgi:hypothetical protein
MPWSTVDCLLHQRQAIRQLSCNAHHLYLYLYTCPAINVTGIFECSFEQMGRETRLEDVEYSLAELVSAELVVYDMATESVWVKNYFSDQVRLGAGDKRQKSIAKICMAYPETHLWGPFYEHYRTLMDPTELSAQLKPYQEARTTAASVPSGSHKAPSTPAKPATPPPAPTPTPTEPPQEPESELEGEVAPETMSSIKEAMSKLMEEKGVSK